MSQSGEEGLWSNVGVRMLYNTISHPFVYAKVLIQIGYEPLPPKPTTTIFGKPALALPNIFQYVRYIKSVDGFGGCYRGLVPQLCAYTMAAVAFEKVSECIVFDDEPNKQIDEEELTEQDRQKRCIYELIRGVISRVVGVIASHPFQVVAVRTMAQFVGGETKYSGLFRSIIEVYREDGISGYYVGVMPRLIANIGILIMVSASTYAINKYIIQDRAMKVHVASIMTFLCITVTYPFYVVSNCMAVNNCGLVAGLPPQMPTYDNWLDCWAHLSSMNQLKRGSSMLWRYYTGPRIGSPSNVKNWRSVAIDKSKFKRLE